MQKFIEVIVFDNGKNNRRAIIPIDNIALIEEFPGFLKVYLKEGNVDHVTLHQTLGQISDLLK